jgi:hypothetical protein
MPYIKKASREVEPFTQPTCRVVPVDEIAARVREILEQDESAWGKGLRRMLIEYSK